LTFIALTIIVPVFDLGMPFGKVQVWKKSRKSLEIYIQNCVATQSNGSFNFNQSLRFRFKFNQWICFLSN